MIENINPNKFPISIKCFDVLNIKNKKMNVIHTFENEEEFNHWKKLVLDWNNFNKQNKKNKRYELLKEPVNPTMEIINYI